MEDSRLIQLSNKDLTTLRSTLYYNQEGKCAICGESLEGQRTHIDHKHATQKETLGENGAGLVRGLCCANCNCMEGKIVNAAKRYQIKDLEQWLHNLIEYHKKPTTNFIHPTEKPKEKKVSKSNYNKLKKQYSLSDNKKKFPEYPKSGKLTKDLAELFNRYGIAPYN